MKYIKEAILAANGRFVSVWYKGLDGDLRHRVIRTGVKKGLKFPSKFRPPNDKIITVFDVTVGEYRTIRTESIIAAQIDKQLWLA